MARSSADLFFSQLLLDYLAHADSITAGVPDATALPKVIMDTGHLQTVPGLVIDAEETGTSSANRRNITLVFALIFRNRATGDDAATDVDSLARSLTRETAAQHLDAIESRLMDRAALSAFIAAQPEERRAGFSIMKWRRLPQPNLRRQEKPQAGAPMTLMCAFELQAFWARQSAA